MLSDEVTNGYSEPILSSLAAAARERGVSLISFVDWVRLEDIRGSRRLVTDLPGPRSVDAILLLSLGYHLSSEDLATYCERFHPLPICSIADVGAPWCSRVWVDNEVGMREGVEHLVGGHGYRRVAFICGPETSEESALRFRVYREVLDRHGIDFDPALVVQGDYTIQSGHAAVRCLLDERQVLPRAIVGANDGMALGALEALNSRGIKVPEQVALLGFDDIDLVRFTEPPLTTVRQPVHELGRAAFELLMEKLELRTAPTRRVLPSQLVVRESCGCAGWREELPAHVRGAATAESTGVQAFSESLPALVEFSSALKIPGAPSTAWAEALSAAFLADLTSANETFFSELRATLQEIATVRGDVGGFQKVITLLWQLSRMSLSSNSPEWRRADLMLHGARLIVSGFAERMQTNRQLRFEDFSQRIILTSNALGLVVDVAAVQSVLAQHLPAYSIQACYLCLYEEEKVGDEPATRLIAGFSEAGQLELGPGGVLFSSDRVLPDGVLPEGSLSGDRAREYLVGPLAKQGTCPGYVVFSKGPSDGFLYEALFAQLGGTMQRLALVERLVAEAALRETAERERLEKELAIATRIQTGVLPRNILVPGLEIAALMLPATEVGGDYYDVLPSEQGCWIGIGDVAGHGVPAGLVMLMLQSVVSVLCRANPGARPSSLLPILNGVLIENIRDRLEQDEYATFTLFHYTGGGRFVFAGAHEDILVWRRATRAVEWIPTPGTWIAATRDIARVTVDSTLTLEEGDFMLLYTDGITEAADSDGERFGMDRLAACVQTSVDSSAEAIRDSVVAAVQAWMSETPAEDDITLVVVRRTD